MQLICKLIRADLSDSIKGPDNNHHTMRKLQRKQQNKHSSSKARSRKTTQKHTNRRRYLHRQSFRVQKQPQRGPSKLHRKPSRPIIQGLLITSLQDWLLQQQALQRLPLMPLLAASNKKYRWIESPITEPIRIP